MHNIDVKINNEVVRLLTLMGASVDVISTLNSRYDTLTDDVVLEMLKELNDTKATEQAEKEKLNG